MAANVLDTARLLEAIAGYDGIDDRQLGAPQPQNVPHYVDSILSARSKGLNGTRIGVLKEAFDPYGLAPTVQRLVRQAIQRFSDLGAVVEEISIPTLVIPKVRRELSS